jgi:hypothetical protein
MVPCFVRSQFNNLVGNVFDAVASDGKEYRLNVKKSDYKTCIFGTAYQELIRDYDMHVGERIRLKWDNSGQFAIFPECQMGCKLSRFQVNVFVYIFFLSSFLYVRSPTVVPNYDNPFVFFLVWPFIHCCFFRI